MENIRRKKKIQFWVQDIFSHRDNFGIFNALNQELKYDGEYYYSYLRMGPERFSYLLSLVQGRISKKGILFRKSISAQKRLILMLIILASGENQQLLSFSFRIGRQSVDRIVAETCEAIYLSLKDIYLESLETPEQWENIYSKSEELWNFPSVFGATDGKHIGIKNPKISRTLYHNYDRIFSLVLLAACDPNYCFSMFDVIEYVSNNDN